MFVFFVQSILQNQKYFQFQIIWKQTKASYSYIRLFKDLNCFIFWQNWSISLLCERWKTWAFVLFYWEKKENYTICGLSLQTRKRSGNLFLHFPINSVEFPWRRCSAALWKLIPSHGLAPFHQGSWWFMSTTADRGTICLRQFLSGRLFFLPRTHTVLCMKSYRLFSQQSGGFYRWPLQVKSCRRSQTTMQTFNMMDGAG